MDLQKQAEDLALAIHAKHQEVVRGQRELQILKDGLKAVEGGKDIFHSNDLESVTVRVLMQKYKQTCI